MSNEHKNFEDKLRNRLHNEELPYDVGAWEEFQELNELADGSKADGEGIAQKSSSKRLGIWKWMLLAFSLLTFMFVVGYWSTDNKINLEEGFISSEINNKDYSPSEIADQAENIEMENMSTKDSIHTAANELSGQHLIQKDKSQLVNSNLANEQTGKFSDEINDDRNNTLNLSGAIQGEAEMPFSNYPSDNLKYKVDGENNGKTNDNKDSNSLLSSNAIQKANERISDEAGSKGSSNLSHKNKSSGERVLQTDILNLDDTKDGKVNIDNDSNSLLPPGAILKSNGIGSNNDDLNSKISGSRDIIVNNEGNDQNRNFELASIRVVDLQKLILPRWTNFEMQTSILPLRYKKNEFYFGAGFSNNFLEFTVVSGYGEPGVEPTYFSLGYYRKVSPSWSIGFEANIMHLQNLPMSRELQDYHQTSTSFEYIEGTYRHNFTNYIGLPITLKYQPLGSRVGVYSGINLAYALYSSLNYQNEHQGDNTIINYLRADLIAAKYYKNLDMGLIAGATIRIWKGLELEGRAVYGLVDVSDDYFWGESVTRSSHYRIGLKYKLLK